MNTQKRYETHLMAYTCQSHALNDIWYREMKRRVKPQLLTSDLPLPLVVKDRNICSLTT